MTTNDFKRLQAIPLGKNNGDPIMNKFIIPAVTLSTAFFLSCTDLLPGDDSGSDSDKSNQEYSYCVFLANEACLDGPFTSCPSGGVLSNSCPYANYGPSSNSNNPITPPSSNSNNPITPPSSNSNNPITQLYCDYGPEHSCGGGCFEIGSASECNTLDGGLVANKCGRTDRLFCDFGPVDAYGGGCYMIASQANCDTEWGRVVRECPASSLNRPVSCGSNDSPSSNSNNPITPPSSNSNNPITQLYCDFGPLHTDGGGCFEISSASECNTLDGGLVANKCGRTDRLFCDYGPINADGGGCYMIASQANCDTEWGRVVRECPASSL